MEKITVNGGQILGHFKAGERYTDAELLDMVPPGMRNSPAFLEGFAEGVRLREDFRAKHGRLPELGEC